MISVKVFKISSYSDEDLLRLNDELDLNLSLDELRAIKKFYSEKSRQATDLELHTFSQVWSEHCFHKTFKSRIKFGNEEIDGIFKTYIFKATKELNKSWCLNTFSDNAGIIEFDDRYAIAVKVETHNHPTALDPFCGAHTGMGGVYRDILGVGARPIASMDYLFFGPLDITNEHVPHGFYHPKITVKRVVEAIADYGNKVGIPTVNGSMFFDVGYVTNPLVYAGCVGIIPKARYIKQPKPGDLILVIGGKTGRDGIHGASFASASLSGVSSEIYYSAVQVGNPIEEKKIIDAILRARDEYEKPLYSLITDLGGGGLAVAVCESFKDLGCRIDLSSVQLKHSNMAPWEIWVSESQERMLISVPKENLEKILEIFEEEGVGVNLIGEVEKSNRVSVYFKEEVVGDIDLNFLFKGIPLPRMKAEIPKLTNQEEVLLEDEEDYTQSLLEVLSHPNISSKEWAIRQYDHEVGARTILKPLQGVNGEGPGDAAVIKPLYDSWKGIVISNGGNPNYSSDPYAMALSAIDEAIRNNVSCGGRRIALLDNFSWGDPNDPLELGKLVLAAKGCYDGAIAFDAPFISGKDSLYNVYHDGKKSISIPPTLMITAIGIIPDVRKSVTTDFKRSGNYIYIIGFTYDELGGSAFFKLKGINGGKIPTVYPERARQIYDRIIKAIDRGLIKACHDCSEGGIAVALAEMCIGGYLGAEVNLDKIPTNLTRKYKILFSESNSRFIVEVAQGYEREFEHLMRGVSYAKIGYVISEKELIINSSKKKIVNASLQDMIRYWKSTLAF